jgi:hypothetical protein
VAGEIDAWKNASRSDTRPREDKVVASGHLFHLNHFHHISISTVRAFDYSSLQRNDQKSPWAYMPFSNNNLPIASTFRAYEQAAPRLADDHRLSHVAHHCKNPINVHILHTVLQCLRYVVRCSTTTTELGNRPLPTKGRNSISITYPFFSSLTSTT